MATPLKPLQSKEELTASLLKTYPTLTREELFEVAAAFGCDLAEEPPADTSAKSTSINFSTLESWGWEDTMHESLGETITIIGAPRPPALRRSPHEQPAAPGHGAARPAAGPDPARARRRSAAYLHRHRAASDGGAQATPQAVAVAVLAHSGVAARRPCARPGPEIHYDHWTSTDGWHGETMTQGDRIETRDYGPRGERHTCRSYVVGSQRYTSCNGN
jgi:hypothetical protein